MLVHPSAVPKGRTRLACTVTLWLVLSSPAACSVTCSYGNGEPDRSHPDGTGTIAVVGNGAAAWSNLSCAPVGNVGPIRATLADALPSTATAAVGPFIDVQAFQYHGVTPAPDAAVNAGRNGAAAAATAAAAAKAARQHRSAVVRIAACALGADGFTPWNETLAYVAQAGREGADLVVLPENARGRPGAGATRFFPPEPVRGANATSVMDLGRIARQFGMYVVFGMREVDASGRQFNAAVVIGRDGSVVDEPYHKVFPVTGTGQGAGYGEHNVVPGLGGVPVFDLDFGRVVLLTCFDVNFVELWHQARAHRADLVLWPSAMRTPDPTIRGYARVFQYPIVAVGKPADIVDATGDAANSTTVPSGFPMMLMGELDLDRTWVHRDNNGPQVAKLLAEQPVDVVNTQYSPFWFLAARTPGEVSVRSLCEEYNITIAHDYIDSSRRIANSLRMKGSPIP